MDVVDFVVLKQLDFLTQDIASEAIKMHSVNSTDITVSSWEEDRKHFNCGSTGLTYSRINKPTLEALVKQRSKYGFFPSVHFMTLMWLVIHFTPCNNGIALLRQFFHRRFQKSMIFGLLVYTCVFRAILLHKSWLTQFWTF